MIDTTRIRAIGMVLMLVSLIGLGYVYAEPVGEQASMMQMSVTGVPPSELLPEQKIAPTLVEPLPADVPVVIELTAPRGTMAISQQATMVMRLQMMDVEITDRFFTLTNAVEATIPRERLAEVAELQEVVRIYDNRPTLEVVSDLPDVRFLSESVPMTTAPSVWAEGITGTDVVVVIQDTGIQKNHPALMRNGVSIVIDSYDMGNGEYTHWHGTHVAGIIASQHNTYKGVAPGVSLVSVHALPGGFGTISDAIKGFEWTANWKNTHPDKMVISSNSWGGHPQAMGCGGWDSPCILCQAANNLAKSGVIVVAAAGNDDSYWSGGYNIECPGQAEKVMTAAAVDKSYNIASFSSRGPTVDGNRKPDASAPGVSIYSCSTPSSWKYASGTSMATPHISGVMALLADAKPGLSPEQYYDAVRDTSIDKGTPGYDYNYGYGFVDAYAAYQSLGATSQPPNVWGLALGMVGLVGAVTTASPEITKELERMGAS